MELNILHTYIISLILDIQNTIVTKNVVFFLFQAVSAPSGILRLQNDGNRQQSVSPLRRCGMDVQELVLCYFGYVM